MNGLRMVSGAWMHFAQKIRRMTSLGAWPKVQIITRIASSSAPHLSQREITADSVRAFSPQCRDVSLLRCRANQSSWHHRFHVTCADRSRENSCTMGRCRRLHQADIWIVSETIMPAGGPSPHQAYCWTHLPMWEKSLPKAGGPLPHVWCLAGRN